MYLIGVVKRKGLKPILRKTFLSVRPIWTKITHLSNNQRLIFSRNKHLFLLFFSIESVELLNVQPATTVKVTFIPTTTLSALNHRLPTFWFMDINST